MQRLMVINDGDFKQALDHYKYPERYPEQPQLAYRQLGEQFLQMLETALQQHHFLLGESASVADVAIFPFIRQFAAVDAKWFANSPYPQLRAWVEGGGTCDICRGHAKVSYLY